MEGDYAPKFQQVLGELPDELAKLGKAYRGCGNALSAFASSLEQAKSQAGAALRQGQDAHNQYQGALREIRAVLPPDRAATVSGGLGPNESLLEAAIADLDEGTKTQARAAARRARFAEQDRHRARRLATDAARLRGVAETTCVHGIHDALNGSGIKNKSWLEKAWNTVSKPFRSWDDFVKLCSTVA
ncbi:MAG: type IV secretion protein Rhs, partial [Actinobacteria bacterium]|nr:type IV secretion protein Rhs [Actinomycetota bacterium]